MNKTRQDYSGLIPSFDLTRDFCTLRASEVERVLEAADLVKYRRPKNANGSRGRYFYARMQRDFNRNRK